MLQFFIASTLLGASAIVYLALLALNLVDAFVRSTGRGVGR